MTKPEPDPKEQANWLTRQWQRVRGQSKRDVIITQVGDNAENVAVGKNIWQINIAGRNLTIPIFITTACLLGIVGYFLFQQYEYLWNPSQMTGTFKIAVAEFGGVTTDGRVGYSAHGAALSESVYNSIRRQYAEHPTIAADEVLIWHDSMDRGEKNITIGVIEGDTPTAREEKAAQIAEKIRADLVIYGHLDSNGSPDSLTLEFFYRSPRVRNEFDLTQGQHSAGAPILVSPSFADDPSLAQLQIREPLDVRAKAISLIAIGLTYDVLGDPKNSLSQFQLAEELFEQLEERQGQEALYYFVGRAALFEDNDVAAEKAFTQATTLDPTYVRAHIGLGGVYLKRAQRLDAKVHLNNLEDLETAIGHYESAVALATESGNELHQAIARLALGSAYRIRGQASSNFDAPSDLENEQAIEQEQDTVALEFYAKAVDELTAVESILAEQKQFRLLAQAYQSQGAAHLEATNIYRIRGEESKNIEALNLAAVAFFKCIEQKSNAPEDSIVTENIIANSCQPFYGDTLELLANAKES